MDIRSSAFLSQRRWTALAGLIAAVALAADLIVIAPVIVSFAFAVSLAVAWCAWLDRPQER